jgi:hypothetical protein
MGGLSVRACQCLHAWVSVGDCTCVCMQLKDTARALQQLHVPDASAPFDVGDAVGTLVGAVVSVGGRVWPGTTATVRFGYGTHTPGLPITTSQPVTRSGQSAPVAAALRTPAALDA